MFAGLGFGVCASPDAKKGLVCWMFRGFGFLGVQGLRAVGLRGIGFRDWGLIFIIGFGGLQGCKLSS